MSENSTACTKCPLETITHILKNIKEDIGSLLSSSLVSHLWRQAALPLLFSTACLRDKADFFRWQEIAQALPSVPLFVRCFIYELGSVNKWNLKQKYAVTSQACISEIMLAMRKGAPSEDITIALPHMPGVVMSEWHTNMTQGIVCTSQVLQFLSPFVNEMIRWICHRMRCFCFSWAVFATRAFAIGGYRCSEAYISSFTIYWRYDQSQNDYHWWVP